jgi:hypothetical protein
MSFVVPGALQKNCARHFSAAGTGPISNNAADLRRQKRPERMQQFLKAFA